MKEYRIAFNGRLISAIGITSFYIEYIKAKTKEQALNKLYEKYEFISGVNIS